MHIEACSYMLEQEGYADFLLSGDYKLLDDAVVSPLGPSLILNFEGFPHGGTASVRETYAVCPLTFHSISCSQHPSSWASHLRER